MGWVWAATHRLDLVPVAVKVLTGEGAQDPYFVQAFRNEVQAVAGLSHPNIVMVLDYGRVSEEAAAASQGRLVAGSPYLAMERASGGTLADHAGGLASWSELRVLLMDLLEALGHAHARGVIHRDFKPSNVLICTQQDLRPGIKLSDFGLAAVPDRAQPEAQQAGTLAYMAPEQLSGDASATGPWTDLFALGVLTWRILQGRLPWGGARSAQDRAIAMQRPPAWGAPRLSVPPELPAWLQLLLNAAPESRFQLAADAQWALSQLSEAPPPSRPPRPLAASDAEPSRTVRLPAHAPAPPVIAGPTLRASPPPMPEDWRSPTPPGLPGRLVGVGLGLCGLRAIPLVDREAHRDALWEALCRVRARREPAMVVLRGPAGCGKSRLAEWLCTRASELGAATVFTASFPASPGPLDGLLPMLVRALGCLNRSPHEAADRLRARFKEQHDQQPEALNALLSLIRPYLSVETSESLPPRSLDQAERAALILDTLERLARPRPALLWVDDAQGGTEALALAEHLLGRARAARGPVLMVLSVQDEALAEEPQVAALLRALSAREGALTLTVEPLDPGFAVQMVRAVLDLEPALAAQVADHCGGNPLFAVTLVGDLAQQGLLEWGDQGFRLRPGATLKLPENLRQIWTERVDRLLSEAPPGSATALELAATLGGRVHQSEWEAVCAEAGCHPPEGLLDALVVRRLARREGMEGWSFAHEMLRGALLERAARAGRLAAHHSAAAAVLAQPGLATAAPDGKGRLGLHLLAAGRALQALEPLTQGVEARLGAGDYLAAEVMLAHLERAQAACALSPDDPSRAQAALLRASLARSRGRMEEAASFARRAESWATERGDPLLRARAMREIARLSWVQGHPEEALSILEQAIRLATAVGAIALRAECHLDRGNILRRRGDSAADEALEEARADSEEVGDTVAAAYALLGRGEFARQSGALRTAKRCYEAAMRTFTLAGCPRGLADAQNSLGELARRTGDLDGAEAWYRAALSRYTSLGSALAIAPECNLGLVLAERGAWKEARIALESVLSRLAKEGRQVHVSVLHAYLLPCCAATGDWSAMERHLTEAEGRLSALSLVEEDVARMTSIAGDIAASAKHFLFAQRAWRLSSQQWQGLGRTAEVVALNARLIRSNAV